jgi:Ca2+-transporting ATPase
MVPFMAIQILWINLVTDSLPALALSTQETESDVMKRKPINESLLAGIH